MRTTILMTPVFLLLAGGVALAQSNQGGYLGKNVGANAPSAATATPTQGSGQGGYLGEQVGATLPSASQDPVKPPSVQGSREGGYLGSIPGAKH